MRRKMNKRWMRRTWRWSLLAIAVAVLSASQNLIGQSSQRVIDIGMQKQFFVVLPGF